MNLTKEQRELLYGTPALAKANLARAREILAVHAKVANRQMTTAQGVKALRGVA
jgi:hypothetical protein